jgi:hypothetical protein
MQQTWKSEGGERKIHHLNPNTSNGGERHACVLEVDTTLPKPLVHEYRRELKSRTTQQGLQNPRNGIRVAYVFQCICDTIITTAGRPQLR